MNYTDFLKNCLEESSTIANANFGNLTHTVKEGDHNQVLTETDIKIGTLLIEKITQVYPGYNIIDEETGVIDKESEFTWVIDPIDGTSNFAAGVPTYGTMLGLLQGSTVIAGGFSLPATHEICIAEKDHGAYINGKQLFVTSEKELSNCLIAYHIDGHPDDPKRTRKESVIFGEVILGARNMRNSGSEPIDGLYVASGKYGALLNQSMKIWDVVAPHIIIEEAGGVYTDFWGEPIDYTNPLTRAKQNFTCCAASRVLHKQLQEIIHEKV